MKKKSQRNIQLIIVIGILILINLISTNVFLRFDMTKEKRYSLSEITRQIADSIEHPLFVTVYMEGNFAPNIRAFQEAVRTALIEIKQYANGNLEFDFVNPSSNPELMASFTAQYFEPVPVEERISSTETKQQLMWPLVKLTYQDRPAVLIDLLRGTTVMTERGPQVSFLKAESLLEYKLISGIRKLLRQQVPLVAILQGHGEKTPFEMPELANEIQSNYTLYTFDMKQQAGQAISPTIQVIIIPQPTQAFSERDKYELDQYLMRGGKILWILDQEKVDMDIFERRSTATQLRDLNLDDMFMQYGFKINYDLIQDLECQTEEFKLEGASGANIRPLKWIFYPLVYEFPPHFISRNIDLVLLRYANSIDTFSVPGVKHSVFMTSSPRSRTIQGSQFVNIDQTLRTPPPPALFNQGNKIMGLASEGIFTSLFNGRDIPTDSLAPNPPTATFGPRNNPIAHGKMVVISDGDIFLPKKFRGKLTNPQGKPNKLPYENKTLLLNSLDYLVGDTELANMRSKDVVARVLDGEKVQSSSFSIQIINILIPLLLIVAFGLGRFYLRKRKYAGK